jgi:hypothetical protein
MVEQADVYVKNIFPSDPPPPDIRVVRKLTNGTIDIDVTIVPGDEEKIPLPEPGVLVVVSPPSGVILEEYWCYVAKGNDIVTCTRNGSTWEIQIMVPNSAVPEVPTTVNIEVGGPPP